MLTVDEALALVLKHARPTPPRRIPLQDALGLVLAEDVTSDIDSPPHDKAMVDGYAVRSADLQSGKAELNVLEEITAGDVPSLTLTPGSSSRIMTGAPIPLGADAVVMVERTEFASAAGAAQAARRSLGTVRIQEPNFKPGQNIMRAGTSIRRGDVVLSAGAPIRPIEIGILAEVGRAEVLATGSVRVAVLATGNELVPAHKAPGAGQIRNSNSPMLVALGCTAKAAATDLGIARDDRQHLTLLIRAGLEHDVLVLSGGVSAGVLDLVPSVLAECSVEQVFHKVRLKPGKPTWFGVRSVADRQTLIFGLPGNPVSSLVCFELFVRPAIHRLASRNSQKTRTISAKLTAPFTHRGDRPTYQPAVLDNSTAQPTVTPLNWRGSADLRTLAQANALAIFPAGDHDYQIGDTLEALRIE